MRGRGVADGAAGRRSTAFGTSGALSASDMAPISPACARIEGASTNGRSSSTA